MADSEKSRFPSAPSKPSPVFHRWAVVLTALASAATLSGWCSEAVAGSSLRASAPVARKSVRSAEGATLAATAKPSPAPAVPTEEEDDSEDEAEDEPGAEAEESVGEEAADADVTAGSDDVAADSKTLDLEGLIALARRYNQGLSAANRATAFVRAQLSEAERSYLPTGEFTSLLAPSPNIKCSPDEQNCTNTGPNRNVPVGVSGVYTRSQITLAQPIYTFGKISAGVAAAEAGVEASKSREAATAAELELNVARAYYGLKLAREIESTLKEGLGYITQAEEMVQKDLDEGSGNMTVTDKLRLQATRAEVEAQALEVGRGGGIALNGLRALVGPTGPQDFTVDAAPLEKRAVPNRPLSYYEEQARLSRPEVRALDYFVRARRKLADLEFSRQLPDLVLVATATYAYASSVEDPRNAFLNDPFNVVTGGFGAMLRVPLDFGPRNARANQATAQAEEAAFRRREALGGIAFEVSKAYLEKVEAENRMNTLAQGEKVSRRWMTSIVQKLDLGLAETREVTDALRSYFTMRVRYLQAIHDFNLAVAALARATGVSVAP